MQYTTLDGDLTSITSADGNGRYDTDYAGGAGTVLLEDKGSGERVLIVHNRYRNGNWTEISSLPDGIDEIRISNAKVKLDVAWVPKLVVDNATLELTVPEVPQLEASNNSDITLAADTATQVSLDGSTLHQAGDLTVDTLTMANGSRWEQASHGLTVTGSYAFQGSTFDYTGTWNRPEGADLEVTGYTMTLPAGNYQYDRLEIGADGLLQVAPFDQETGTGGNLSLEVSELVIDEDGRLTASGKGLLPGEDQPSQVGGSHGGLGGAYSGSQPLDVYGNADEPATQGTGAFYGSTVVRGGGAIKIVASSMEINGSIDSNGTSYNYGGGAGGSVWIKTGSIQMGESGQVTANGGRSRYRGDGGGGRLALYYKTSLTNDLEAHLSAKGGDYNGSQGEDGTVVVEQVSGPIKIVSTSLAAKVGQIQSIDVRVSNELDLASLTSDDIAVDSNSNEPLPFIADIVQLTKVDYRLVLSEPLAEGNYSISIGPDIQSLDGHGMDQNGDGETGTASDVYQYSFVVDANRPDALTLTSHDALSTIESSNRSIQLVGERGDEPLSVWVNGQKALALGSGSWAVDVALEEGDNAIEIYGVNEAGVQSDPLIVSVNVDSMAPDVSGVDVSGYLPSPPDQINLSVSESGTGIDLDASEIRLERDGQSVPVSVTLADDHIAIVPSAPLVDGQYALKARIEDRRGNASPSGGGVHSYTFTVDTQSPDVVTLDDYPTLTNINAHRFSGTREAGATILVNGAPVNASGSGTDWNYQVALEEGTNELTFAQRDQAGNTGPAISASIAYNSEAPGPVTVSADENGDGTSIQLTWSGYDEFENGNDIAEYRVYLSPSPFESTEALTPYAEGIPAGTQHYKLAGLSRGATVYVAVTARDEGGLEMTAVDSKSLTPVDVVPPDAISGLAVEPTSSTLSLSWGASDNSDGDLAGYRVTVGSSGNTTAIDIPVTDATVQNGRVRYELTGLEPATKHPLHVVAYDNDGNETSPLQDQGVTLLANPTDLTGEGLAGRVQVNWSASQPANLVHEYRLYVSPEPFSSVAGMSPSRVVSASSRSSSVAGLENDTPYYVAVTAVNLSGGESPDVAPITLTPEEDQDGPDVTRLFYMQQDGTEVELTGGGTVTHSGILNLVAEDESGLAKAVFSLDGQALGTSLTGTPAFNVALDLQALADGTYTLQAVVSDSIGNDTTISVPLQVSLATPPAPAFLSPADGYQTNAETETVTGQSEANTLVAVTVNGQPLAEPVQAGSDGRFSVSVPLEEGANVLSATAAYASRMVYGDASAERTIVRDTSVPDAPTGLSATGRELGEINLAWGAPDDDRVAGFLVYRSDEPFTATAEATPLTASPLTGSTYRDLPESDGTYYYRVVSVNVPGTESVPSPIAEAEADSTPPHATHIEYTPMGAYDADGNRFGPGQVNVTVTFSEALRNTPYLALTVSGGIPQVVDLQPDYNDPLVYTGSFTLTETAISGTAYAVLSAHDQVGNRGTEVDDGSVIVIDTDGPQATALTLAPSAPIRNTLDEGGQGQAVQVTLALNDTPADGTQPVLIPSIEGASDSDVVAGYESGLPLTLDAAASTPGAPVYTSDFRLPADAGRDDSGQDTAEILTFAYSATDDLGNKATGIDGPSRFQVYQGDLPPVDSPSGLNARALPGGEVELTWNPVDGAAQYRLYRQSPTDSELLEAETLDNPAQMRFVDDATLVAGDGVYQYAITSIRAKNGQTNESAQSEPVSVSADATPPSAPVAFALELNGAGVVGRWQPPADEVADGALSYNLYRLDLPEGTENPDLTDVTPNQTDIPELIALDKRPSATEHLYVVTAVDEAGNESLPSNSDYVNVDLLPVSDLGIHLSDAGLPVLTWDHSRPSSVQYNIYRVTDGEPVPLNEEPLTAPTFEDTTYNGGTPTHGAPADRRYSVKAVDSNGVQSIAHELTLPALQVALAEPERTDALQRGVMNRVPFRVTNTGEQPVVQARLKVIVMDEGQPRVHWSERFAVDPGSYTDVPVIIGGYDGLPSLASLDIQIVLEPQAGESVTIQQLAETPVGQSGLVAGLELEHLVRGATGEARLRIENPSEVETEILMARNDGDQASSEVRLRLEDADGNVLAVQPVQQVTGHVITVASGETVARVGPGETYLSDPIELRVPGTAPDDIRVTLEIDHFRYHTGRDTFVQIAGTQAKQPASLEETPYYGALTAITPQTVFAGDSVDISGQALDRATDQPLGNVPLTLVLTVRGFERSFPVYTDASGAFSYTFEPGLSESGDYRVSVLHPDMLERPEDGQFIVEGAGVSPTQAKITVPRNYDYTLKVKVKSGYATDLSRVRLVYQNAQDANGDPLPLPEGLQYDVGAARDIGANQQAYLNLTFSGSALAADEGTLRFNVMADNRSAPLDTVTVHYYLTAAKPVLQAQPSVIETGVSLGQSQQESLSLQNTGVAAAENVRLSLTDGEDGAAPDWFKLLTASQLGSLPVDSGQGIQVAVEPDDSVPEGNYVFRIKVESDNFDTFTVPVSVAVTQSGEGDVFIHASDIYTATPGDDGTPIPGLANVKVKLQNENVLSETYTKTTDANGEALLEDLPAGRYTYRASAFDHDAVTGHLWVKPGVTATEEVFLMNALINVEFSVKEITLEDRYEVVLDATYETNVPAPVILFDPMSVNLPMMEKGDVYQGEFTLTNHGALEAYDVAANLPSGDDYARFEYLGDIPDVVRPNQVVRVPYRIVALKDFNPGDGGSGCLRRNYEAVCNYSAQCAAGSVLHSAARMVWNAISGTSCSSSGGSGGGGIFTGGYAGGGGGGTNYSPAPTTSIGTAESFCPGSDGSGDNCGGKAGTEGGY
ncbi:fibronectin type III domain-containing protein [Marinobacter halodurans]|uniref:fibronectin type III domain-containing protein n=1 Tax=Marinobacter halodurans TaxID=2528979 RepID=UPI001A955024|nr:fibronectin type III domain-containing protein [Marinobacter halodurans]